ncbi:MAG: hypothetical protein AUI99_06200 [Gemmatimonadetes bacterium 13_1_40CM_3_69_22]|nr:MAG: hypothetical protein AUH12_05520 [Gemmatimonadetes bacterium 13_2_20CM_69_8]OLD02036.1 MAG: hypothetical protein AUI99_06200 [Gemmatimonadetes bacterium 13_1_40CM_3_69_22]
MTDDTEQRLQQQFRALRGEVGVGGGTPRFHDTIAGLATRRERAAQVRRRSWEVAGGIALAAAAVALLAVLRPGGTRALPVSLAAARWEAPTDFLLRTPGAELLRMLPTFTTEGRLLP